MYIFLNYHIEVFTLVEWRILKIKKENSEGEIKEILNLPLFCKSFNLYLSKNHLKFFFVRSTVDFFSIRFKKLGHNGHGREIIGKKINKYQ